MPAYLHDDLRDYQPIRMLRSSNAHLLQRPLVLTSVASRAFPIAAPTVWNSLSVNTRSADSFGSFKRRLKTELFASLTPPRTVQRHHSAQIRVPCDLSSYINLLVVVVGSAKVVLVCCAVWSSTGGTLA